MQKERLQLINKTNTPFKNEQRIWIDIFPRKTHKWPTGTLKIYIVTNHHGNENQNYKKKALHTC